MPPSYALRTKQDGSKYVFKSLNQTCANEYFLHVTVKTGVKITTSVNTTSDGERNYTNHVRQFCVHHHSDY